MKKLNELVQCEYDIDIASVEDDSRIRADNYLFCCIEGLTVDGHKYIDTAIENGAVAILAQKPVEAKVPVVMVKDTNKAMLEALSNLYDNVDKKMKLIGVTGTDGKTTVSSMIFQLINMMDRCGYIGTNGIKYGNITEKLNYTTPLPKELYKAFSNFYNDGCHYVSLEVSSERLLTKRLDDLSFDITIFTNITHDHLNHHKTFENYLESKGKLFSMTKNDGFCILNADDKNVDYMKKCSTGKVVTFGIDNNADFKASDIIIAENRLLFELITSFGTYRISSPLSGKFNVYNLMAVIATCYYLGFDINKIIENIKYLEPITGRNDIINYNNHFKVIIDYAHTAFALKNILDYARVITKNKVITVTGSAGGKDSLKRPDMGKVVTSLSDYVIFTADDPRYEDPNDIIDALVSEINPDIHNYERVIDRAVAIKKALSMTKDGDVVVIAGRGNDTFMPIGDGFIRCNDYEEVYKNMKEGVTA